VKGHREGKKNISAEPAPSQPDPWLSGPNEHEKRAAGLEAPPREGPQTADGQQRIEQRFRPSEHIRRRSEFQSVYDRGVKAHGPLCTLFLLPNGRPEGRLGIAATRKLGGAVERNRAKRLIREVFRRNKIAPGADVVVVPRRALLDASLTALEAEYRRLVERSSRVIDRRV
jgi:ribonuclease P protein component